jgi:pyrroline-5-carboxylate reductase
MTPILVIGGAGRMGGALVAGWRRAKAFAESDILILDPQAGMTPADADIGRAKTVVLVVKPQTWREAAAEIAPKLAAEAVIVSICAGVASADIAAAFGRRVARVMPTTAAAIGQGTASIYAADPEARARAHALMAPVGAVVDLDDENLMHAATAVSGSAPAYFYAFVEALAAAGERVGLTRAQSETLARATMAGAAALMADSGADPADLRKQVTSPGGTTEAALKVLMGEAGLGPLLEAAVQAATDRSRELGK